MVRTCALRNELNIYIIQLYLNMIEEEHFFQEQKRITRSEIVQFQSPCEDTINQVFSTFKQIRLTINTLDNPQSKSLWTIRQIRQKYLYFTCKYCSSFITFKYDGAIKVLKFNNNHQHEALSLKQRQQKQIQEFILHLPNFYHPQQIMTMVLSKFSISKRRFYYIYEKKFKNKSYNEIQKELISQNCKMLVYYGEQDKFPELFLYTTPETRDMFHQYGDCCMFDITYNLIKERSCENKQWGVGIFSGLDKNLRLVVFAVTLMARETTQSFERVFSAFFDIFDRQPQTIITDQQLAINTALSNLKSTGIFRGNHSFDVYHILKNLKKKVTKQDFQHYRYLIKARNKQSFENCVTKAFDNHINQGQLESFIEKSRRFCFSQLPPVFTGFSSSNSSSEKLNDILKGFIPHQVSFSVFFYRMNKFIRHIVSKLNTKQFECKLYQELFQDHAISGMRKLLEKKVFQKFISSYTKGLRLECQLIQNDTYKCCSFKEKWIVKNQNCSCQILQKTGIPCQHLIKVLWTKGKYNYIKFVNPRWIKNNEQIAEFRGRPKLSRKNIL